jgi:hypothetical protein
VIEDLYPQSGGLRVDGVVSLDPVSLAAQLRVVGPVQVHSWPVPLTPENVVQVLEHDQYVQLTGPTRDAFLGEVIATVFRAAVSHPIAAGRAFAETFRPVTRQRDLMVHFADASEQQFVASLGLDGRLPEARGDFLAVITQNSSGNKIDWFLRRSTHYDVQYDPASGATTADLTITLRNLAPASGEPDYIIGSGGPGATRRGENRVYLSVYSPLTLGSASSGGRSLALKQEDESGRHVYSAFVTVPPRGELQVRIRLTGDLYLGSGYQLGVRHQVLAEAEQFSGRLSVGGRRRPPWLEPLVADAIFSAN